MKTNFKSIKKETGLFLVLTFTFTYALFFFMIGNSEFFNNNNALFIMALQMVMLFPAASAIVTNFIFYKKEAYCKKTRLFFIYFLAITVINITYFMIKLGTGFQSVIIDSLFSVLFLIPLIMVIYMNLRKKYREDLKKDNLLFNKPKYYFYFSLVLVILFLGGAFLNNFFGFGAPESDMGIFALIVMGIQAVTLIPILGFTLMFGEEYGWRIFLQERLISIFGKVKGIVLLGIIWGLWHIPMVISFGWAYPGHPILGSILFIVFTVVMSIFLGLSVFKTNSVLLPVFIHGVNNAFARFSMNISTPTDFAYGFGIGIYGLLIFGLVALYMLKHKEWRKNEIQNFN